MAALYLGSVCGLVVCRAVPSTTPNCTSPARWLEQPLPVTAPVTCQLHLSIATAIRHPPSVVCHPSYPPPNPGTLSPALLRDDGFSLLSHPHKGAAPRETSAYVCFGPGYEEDGQARTRRGIRTTQLGNPPCIPTPYHLTCGISCETPEHNLWHLGRSWAIPFYILTGICTKLRSLRQ